MAAGAQPRAVLSVVRRGGLAVGVLACLLIAGPALAQDQPLPDVPDVAPEAAPEPAPLAPIAASPILTLDQERFFRETVYGQAALRRAEEETSALAAENRRIESALEAEERDLTERRPILSPQEFAPLAAAFDAKVEEIRTAQDAKSRAISRRLEEDRQAFFQVAVPVLGQLLEDSGAVAILADDAIILSLTSLDATDVAIARMDAALATAQEAPPSPEPAPEPAPEPTPPNP